MELPRPKEVDASMASSSAEKICHFCRKWPTNLRDGWKLSDGSFASLCNKCATAFENNSICLSFHKEETGWRDCTECGKSIHCGCIVDRHTYIPSDFGGITCIGCLIGHFSAVPNNLSTHPEEVDQSVPNSEDCPDSLESGISGKNSMQKGYQGDCMSSEILSGEVMTHIENFLSSDGVLRDLYKLVKYKVPALVPLFEIMLSPGDADPRIGRLVIPETYAQVFFLNALEGRGIAMRIWDSECRLWRFMLRTMVVKKKQLTVLDGTRKCIRTMKWKSGDILKFYRKDPEGEMFIGLKKMAGVGSSTEQVQNPSSSEVS